MAIATDVTGLVLVGLAHIDELDLPGGVQLRGSLGRDVLLQVPEGHACSLSMVRIDARAGLSRPGAGAAQFLSESPESESSESSESLSPVRSCSPETFGVFGSVGPPGMGSPLYSSGSSTFSPPTLTLPSS